MATFHDRSSMSLAATSTSGRREAPRSGNPPAGLPLLCQECGTDPLSDVLRTVKLTGALFHFVEASMPWGVEIPRASAYASILLPGAQHAVSYHIILEGSGWVTMPGVADARFEAGDILVLPHGGPYSLLSSPGQRPEFETQATIAFFRDMVAGRLPFVTREGGEAIRLRLTELIFVEVVRQCLESLPPEETGWLSGLRDPAIGKVLAALHQRPAHSWTLKELARQAGMSRAALAARFAQLVGYSPMQYLTLWRMQIAARLLADGSMKVAAVGREIGYASEAAFSRAFKKSVGVSPAIWRRGPTTTTP